MECEKSEFQFQFKVSADYLLGLDPKETIDISDLAEEDVALLRVLAERMRKGAKEAP